MEKQKNVIAIVENDPGVRKALGRLLSAFGYQAETFASAGEFLGAAATSKAACIVVDVELADVSGLELVRRLSATDLKFPVIFISRSEDGMFETQAMDLGAIAYLRKPFPVDQLIEAIKKATGSNPK